MEKNVIESLSNVLAKGSELVRRGDMSWYEFAQRVYDAFVPPIVVTNNDEHDCGLIPNTGEGHCDNPIHRDYNEVPQTEREAYMLKF